MIFDIKGRIMIDSVTQLKKLNKLLTKFNKKAQNFAFDGGINCSNSEEVIAWRDNQKLMKETKKTGCFIERHREFLSFIAGMSVLLAICILSGLKICGII